MITQEEVKELLNPIKDPFLHRTLEETGGIISVTIKEDKKHVSVKIGISKTNTAEQMQMQQEIVGILKRSGANTVGLRFEQLPDEALADVSSYKTEFELDWLAVGRTVPHVAFRPL